MKKFIAKSISVYSRRFSRDEGMNQSWCVVTFSKRLRSNIEKRLRIRITPWRPSPLGQTPLPSSTSRYVDSILSAPLCEETITHPFLQQWEKICIGVLHHTNTADIDADSIAAACLKRDWSTVLSLLKQSPSLALKTFPQANNVTSSILHTAFTDLPKGSSKELKDSDCQLRVKVIEFILKCTPSAATILNGHKNLPLHVCLNRNCGIPLKKRADLIRMFLDAYPASAATPGGKLGRLPLHCICADFFGNDLVTSLLEANPSAASTPDKEGNLPLHVACARYCTIEKFNLLRKANPDAVFTTNNMNELPLDMALKTSSIKRPNKALIEAIKSIASVQETSEIDVGHIDPDLFKHFEERLFNLTDDPTTEKGLKRSHYDEPSLQSSDFLNYTDAPAPKKRKVTLESVSLPASSSSGDESDSNSSSEDFWCGTPTLDDEFTVLIREDLGIFESLDEDEKMESLLASV